MGGCDNGNLGRDQGIHGGRADKNGIRRWEEVPQRRGEIRPEQTPDGSPERTPTAAEPDAGGGRLCRRRVPLPSAPAEGKPPPPASAAAHPPPPPPTPPGEAPSAPAATGEGTPPNGAKPARNESPLGWPLTADSSPAPMSALTVEFTSPSSRRGRLAPPARPSSDPAADGAAAGATAEEENKADPHRPPAAALSLPVISEGGGRRPASAAASRSSRSRRALRKRGPPGGGPPPDRTTASRTPAMMAATCSFAASRRPTAATADASCRRYGSRAGNNTPPGRVKALVGAPAAVAAAAIDASSAAASDASHTSVARVADGLAPGSPPRPPRRTGAPALAAAMNGSSPPPVASHSSRHTWPRASPPPRASSAIPARRRMPTSAAADLAQLSADAPDMGPPAATSHSVRRELFSENEAAANARATSGKLRTASKPLFLTPTAADPKMSASGHSSPSDASAWASATRPDATSACTRQARFRSNGSSSRSNGSNGPAEADAAAAISRDPSRADEDGPAKTVAKSPAASSERHSPGRRMANASTRQSVAASVDDARAAMRSHSGTYASRVGAAAPDGAAASSAASRSTDADTGTTSRTAYTRTV